MSLIFLQEVAAVVDDRELLGGREQRLDLATRRLERQRNVRVAPHEQRRTRIGAKHVRHLLALGRARRIRGQRQHQREGARAGLRLGRWKRGVVRVHDFGRHPSRTGSFDEHRHRQVLGALDEISECVPCLAHLLATGEQSGVHDHEPRDPVRVLDREAKADRSAPVVHDDGRVAQVEAGQQPLHRLDVAVVGVPRHVGRLVRPAEPRQVGNDAAEAGIPHRREHLAP